MEIITLLDSIQQNSNVIHEDVQKHLIEATLHFLHVSTYNSLESISSAKTINLLNLINSNDTQFVKSAKEEVNNLKEEWEKRVIYGFINLLSAANLFTSISFSKSIANIISHYRAQYLKIIKYAKSYNPEDYAYLNISIQNHIDFSVPLTSSISTALSTWISYKGVINSSKLEPLTLIDDITIEISSNPGIYGACILLSENMPNFYDIDGKVNRTLDLVTKADMVARNARKSNKITEYLNRVLISHLLYSVSKESLSWIINRYKENNSKPPDEIIDEKRVAEENRVESLCTLRSSCGSLISEPITDLLGKLMTQGPLNDSHSIKRLLTDGAYRNPVYHEKLKTIWHKVSDELFLPEHTIEFEQVLDRAMQIQKIARKYFHKYFQDENIALIVSNMQSKWYFDKMNFHS